MSVELSTGPLAPISPKPSLADIDPLALIMSAVCAPDVEDRVEAAHWAVEIYLDNVADPDRQSAPLMAALLSFLKDPETRVRGAIAMSLLQSDDAPRAIMLQLLSDAPVIAAAIAQHCKVLADCDLLRIANGTDAELHLALARREQLSTALISALIENADAETAMRLIARDDIELSSSNLAQLCAKFSGDSDIETQLLARPDLSGILRLNICLANLDSYYGTQEGEAPANDILAQQWRAARDDLSAQLVDQAEKEDRFEMITHLVDAGLLTPRMMARGLVSGYFSFLEASLVHLAKMPPRRVAELFMNAPLSTLAAVYKKCGTSTAFAHMMAFATMKAREIDLEYEARSRFMLVNDCIAWIDANHADESFQSVYQFLCELSVDFAREAVEEVSQPSHAPLALAAPETYEIAA